MLFYDKHIDVMLVCSACRRKVICSTVDSCIEPPFLVSSEQISQTHIFAMRQLMSHYASTTPSWILAMWLSEPLSSCGIQQIIIYYYNEVIQSLPNTEHEIFPNFWIMGCNRNFFWPLLHIYLPSTSEVKVFPIISECKLNFKIPEGST